MILIHATGLFFEGKGLLIMGPSGSGKSDLALRLMALGGELIGDDYLEISGQSKRQGKKQLIMATPENIEGLIEVRNVGILEVAFRPNAPVDLVLSLVPYDQQGSLERLAEPKTTVLEAVSIPCLDFYAFEVSATEKIRAAFKILL